MKPENPNTSYVERMLAHWRREGVEPNPGATPAALEALAEFLGGPLPADVHRFYATANGMPDTTSDSKLVCFWSIERILRENDIAPIGPNLRGVAFADVDIDAWRLRYALAPGGMTGVRGEGRFPPDHASLSAFFAYYLAAPDA